MRIQINFPGIDTTLLRTFSDTDTLTTVVDYVKDELKKETFTLWNTYPRRQYKSSDLQNTLLSLGLVGSVKLLGMSGGGYTQAPPESAPVAAEQPSGAGSSSEMLVGHC